MFSIVRLTTVEEMLVHHELLQQSYPDMKGY
jgi:hypothetical protein